MVLLFACPLAPEPVFVFSPIPASSAASCRREIISVLMLPADESGDAVNKDTLLGFMGLNSRLSDCPTLSSGVSCPDCWGVTGVLGPAPGVSQPSYAVGGCSTGNDTLDSVWGKAGGVTSTGACWVREGGG